LGEKPSESIDPEEMRYNPKTKSVVWSSEGARVMQRLFGTAKPNGTNRFKRKLCK
jgi:hypothetical protein